MLTHEDLIQIGEVVEKKLDARFEAVFMPRMTEQLDNRFESIFMPRIGEEMGKVIEQNVTPVLDGILQRLNTIEGTMVTHSGLDERLAKMQNTMVTKSYLDDKLADLKGEMVVLHRNQDKKMNSLIDILQGKSVLAATDVAHIKQIEVFPTSS